MKKFDLSVTTGKYEVNGQTKSRYEMLGEVHENRDGRLYARMNAFRLLGVAMAAISRGDDQLMVNLYEPRNEGFSGASAVRQASNGDGFADDVPF